MTSSLFFPDFFKNVPSLYAINKRAWCLFLVSISTHRDTPMARTKITEPCESLEKIHVNDQSIHCRSWTRFQSSLSLSLALWAVFFIWENTTYDPKTLAIVLVMARMVMVRILWWFWTYVVFSQKMCNFYWGWECKSQMEIFRKKSAKNLPTYVSWNCDASLCNHVKF